MTTEYTIQSRGYRFVKYVRFRRLYNGIIIRVKVFDNVQNEASARLVKCLLKYFQSHIYIYFCMVEITQ